MISDQLDVLSERESKEDRARREQWIKVRTVEGVLIVKFDHFIQVATYIYC